MKRLTRYSLFVAIVAAILAFLKSRQQGDPLPHVPDGSPPWPPLRDTVTTTTTGHSATTAPAPPAQESKPASTPTTQESARTTTPTTQESGRTAAQPGVAEERRPDSDHQDDDDETDETDDAVCGDVEAGWMLPDEDGNPPEGYPIKAKLSSKIYHSPGQLNYDRTVPDRCYVDDIAAEADGLRPAKR